jgi:hypothetical protein
MERREERLEKRREPIGFRFESRGRAMQTRAASICLFELVAKDSIAFERAINQVTLCMFQFSSGTEFVAVDGEFGAHPIRRQRDARAVEENETGNFTVGRKDFKRSIRRQASGKVRRQTKYKMRLRKLKLDSRFAVDPASLDALHGNFFLCPSGGQCQQKRRLQSGNHRPPACWRRLLSICEPMVIRHARRIKRDGKRHQRSFFFTLPWTTVIISNPNAFGGRSSPAGKSRTNYCAKLLGLFAATNKSHFLARAELLGSERSN